MIPDLWEAIPLVETKNDKRFFFFLPHPVRYLPSPTTRPILGIWKWCDRKTTIELPEKVEEKELERIKWCVSVLNHTFYIICLLLRVQSYIVSANNFPFCIDKYCPGEIGIEIDLQWSRLKPLEEFQEYFSWVVHNLLNSGNVVPSIFSLKKICQVYQVL